MHHVHSNRGFDMGNRMALRSQEAAHYIGMSDSFLRQARIYGDLPGRTSGPPYIKVGRSVRYLVTDLETWLAEHRTGQR